jgi:ribosome biogenesis protein Nip4
MLQVSRDKLVALGTCIGKFTHSGKFRLTIGCLDIMAQYAKYKESAWCFRRGIECIKNTFVPIDAKTIQSST